MQTEHPGVLDSMRQLSAAGVRLYRARFEMAMLELKEEVLRAKRRILLWTGAGFFLLFGFALATAVGVYYLSTLIGMGGALAAFAGLFFILAAALFFTGKSQMNGKHLFAQTRAEFDKDRKEFHRILEARREAQREEDEEEAGISNMARSHSTP